MSNPDIVIRDAAEADFAAIVALNADQVQHTSAMDLARLQHLHELSAYHRVALVAGEFAGFLLVMREQVDYDSENYRWFSEHLESFAYVDRIVVSECYWGLGLATRLYEDLIEFARRWSAPAICCEYNLEPPNPPSASFHQRMGFAEIAQQRVQGGKLVSLQLLQLSQSGPQLIV